MDETRVRRLARHRVGDDKSMGLAMTQEEIKARKEYMRTMLRRVAVWGELTDAQLDDIRIYRSGDNWYIEDCDFYEYQF